MPDPDWLAEIDAREKVATEGPWQDADSGGNFHRVVPVSVLVRGGDGKYIGTVSEVYHPWLTHNCPNALFVAHSRTDVPLMRDMLRLLAEALGRATPPESDTHEQDWWCPSCQEAINCATSDDRCPTCGTYLGDCQPDDWAKEARAALEAYRTGKLPQKGTATDADQP